MSNEKFSDWLNKQESVRHHFLWGDDIEPTSQRDNLGIPLLKRPGFRPKEKRIIEDQSAQVESWLNSVTNKYGINWEIIYLEPNENETDSPEGFEAYKKRSINIAKEKFEDLLNTWRPDHPDKKPPAASNTIIYVKSTSRVHPLGSHQQVHNIAHAVWGCAKEHRNKFIMKLERIVGSIKKRLEYMQMTKNLPYNDVDPKIKDKNISKFENYINQINYSDFKELKNIEKVSEAEIIVTIGRLINLKSMKRMFSMSSEDFSNPKKTINQVYGNFEEFLYELVAAFFRGGGRINLRPQPDLIGPLKPTSGIQNHPSIQSPKSWAWEELFKDNNFWEDASDDLTLIVISALNECTYGKLGRPIYATYGGLPQT